MILQVDTLQNEINEVGQQFGLSTDDIHDCFIESLRKFYKADYIEFQGQGIIADDKYYTISAKAYSKITKNFYNELIRRSRQTLRDFIDLTVSSNGFMLYCELIKDMSNNKREYYRPYLNKDTPFNQLLILNELEKYTVPIAFPKRLKRVPVEIVPVYKKKSERKYLARGNISTEKTMKLHIKRVNKKIEESFGFSVNLSFHALRVNEKKKEVRLFLNASYIIHKKENLGVIKYCVHYFKTFNIELTIEK